MPTGYFLYGYGQTVEFFFQEFCRDFAADCPTALCFQFLIQPPGNLAGITIDTPGIYFNFAKQMCPDVIELNQALTEISKIGGIGMTTG